MHMRTSAATLSHGEPAEAVDHENLKPHRSALASALYCAAPTAEQALPERMADMHA